LCFFYNIWRTWRAGAEPAQAAALATA